jgi:photosystem II stability/assembly factor-like uncharacterized protein
MVGTRVRLVWILVALLALLSALLENPSRPDLGSDSGGAQSAAYEEEEEGLGPEDQLLFQRFFPGQTVSADFFERAAARSRAIASATRKKAPRLAGARWKLVGPTNVGGRVTDIAIDPKKKDTLFVAAASGGVWRSTDAARTFKPAWPRNHPQGMGALVMTKKGVLYAGTGETNPGGGSIVYGGNGIYKSTNRGHTWKNVGLRDSSAIGRIAVDPKDPSHLLVAVSGNLFKPGGQRGLYETKNGGRTWKRILKPPNPTTGAADVAFDPKNPKRIFVSMWDHIRYPDVRVYAGPGSGLWRSTNSGKDFDQLGPANGLPPSTNDTGRIGIGIDPSHPKNVYTIFSTATGTYGGFFKSTNGGDSWMLSPGASTLAEAESVYAWWFGRIWVDPRNSDHVFVAGVPLAESKDGGMTFPTRQGQQHADHHAMAWDPKKKGRVYNGNDGGVYRSEKNGASTSWIAARYEPYVQFYSIDVSEQKPSRVNGGLQDNGSVRSWNGTDWNEYYGGDGVKNLINPNDFNNVFACSQYGACARSIDGGNRMEDIELKYLSTRKNWLTPIEVDSKNENIVFIAGDTVNRSTDKGDSFTPISPDLGRDPGRETNPLYAGHYGTVTTIGITAADRQTVYAGTDNGRLWVTRNQGLTWTELQHKNLPNRWVTRIAVSQKDPKLAFASFSGFRQGDHSSYVAMTSTAGNRWRDIDGNLPKAPVNDVVLVGKKLYAATDVGVFVTKSWAKKRTTWLKVGSALPLISVHDLKYVPKNDTLYAGTFGRGIWKVKEPRF